VKSEQSLEEEKTFAGRPTVLVVEDNIPSLHYLLFLLKKLKINSVSASSGEDALEVMKTSDVDCMLLDINLGAGMSGITLMEEFRKQGRFILTPMIAVTAYYKGGMSKELIDKGFTDYLPKPFRMEQLKEMLKKYIPVNDIE
jgi:CheY-like chemotaxis protein